MRVSVVEAEGALCEDVGEPYVCTCNEGGPGAGGDAPDSALSPTPALRSERSPLLEAANAFAQALSPCGFARRYGRLQSPLTPAPPPDPPPLLRRRSEGRLKRVQSIEDSRPWSLNAATRRDHLLELVARSYKPLPPGSLIPIDVLVKSLLPGTNAEISASRTRPEERNEHAGDDRSAIFPAGDEVCCLCKCEKPTGVGGDADTLQQMVEARELEVSQCERLLLRALWRLEELAAAAEGRDPRRQPRDNRFWECVRCVPCAARPPLTQEEKIPTAKSDYESVVSFTPATSKAEGVGVAEGSALATSPAGEGPFVAAVAVAARDTIPEHLSAIDRTSTSTTSSAARIATDVSFPSIERVASATGSAPAAREDESEITGISFTSAASKADGVGVAEASALATPPAGEGPFTAAVAVAARDTTPEHLPAIDRTSTSTTSSAARATTDVSYTSIGRVASATGSAPAARVDESEITVISFTSAASKAEVLGIAEASALAKFPAGEGSFAAAVAAQDATFEHLPTTIDRTPTSTTSSAARVAKDVSSTSIGRVALATGSSPAARISSKPVLGDTPEVTDSFVTSLTPAAEIATKIDSSSAAREISVASSVPDSGDAYITRSFSKKTSVASGTSEARDASITRAASISRDKSESSGLPDAEDGSEAIIPSASEASGISDAPVSKDKSFPISGRDLKEASVASGVYTASEVFGSSAASVSKKASVVSGAFPVRDVSDTGTASVLKYASVSSIDHVSKEVSVVSGTSAGAKTTDLPSTDAHPDETFSAASLPTKALRDDAVSADASPDDALLAKSLPIDAILGDVPSADTHPAGTLSASTFPTDVHSNEVLPSNVLPSGTLPTGAIFVDALSAATLPSQGLPPDVLPSGALSTDVLPSGALSTDVLPTGALPTDVLPSDSLPADARLPDAFSVSTIPADDLTIDALPIDAIPTGAVPAEILSVDAVLTDSLPTDSFPTEAIYDETIPGDAPPSDALLSDALPVHVLPTDAISAGASPATSTFRSASVSIASGPEDENKEEKLEEEECVCKPCPPDEVSPSSIAASSSSSSFTSFISEVCECTSCLSMRHDALIPAAESVTAESRVEKEIIATPSLSAVSPRPSSEQQTPSPPSPITSESVSGAAYHVTCSCGNDTCMCVSLKKDDSSRVLHVSIERIPPPSVSSSAKVRVCICCQCNPPSSPTDVNNAPTTQAPVKLSSVCGPPCSDRGPTGELSGSPPSEAFTSVETVASSVAAPCEANMCICVCCQRDRNVIVTPVPSAQKSTEVAISSSYVPSSAPKNEEPQPISATPMNIICVCGPPCSGGGPTENLSGSPPSEVFTSSAATVSSVAAVAFSATAVASYVATLNETKMCVCLCCQEDGKVIVTPGPNAQKSTEVAISSSYDPSSAPSKEPQSISDAPMNIICVCGPPCSERGPTDDLSGSPPSEVFISAAAAASSVAAVASSVATLNETKICVCVCCQENVASTLATSCGASTCVCVCCTGDGKVLITPVSSALKSTEANVSPSYTASSAATLEETQSTRDSPTTLICVCGPPCSEGIPTDNVTSSSHTATLATSAEAVASTLATSCGAKTCVCVCCTGDEKVLITPVSSALKSAEAIISPSHTASSAETQEETQSTRDSPTTLICVCGPPCSEGTPTDNVTSSSHTATLTTSAEAVTSTLATSIGAKTCVCVCCTGDGKVLITPVSSALKSAEEKISPSNTASSATTQGETQPTRDSPTTLICVCGPPCSEGTPTDNVTSSSHTATLATSAEAVASTLATSIGAKTCVCVCCTGDGEVHITPVSSALKSAEENISPSNTASSATTQGETQSTHDSPTTLICVCGPPCSEGTPTDNVTGSSHTATVVTTAEAVASTLATSCGAKTCVCVCCTGDGKVLITPVSSALKSAEANISSSYTASSAAMQEETQSTRDSPTTLICVCGPPCSEDHSGEKLVEKASQQDPTTAPAGVSASPSTRRDSFQHVYGDVSHLDSIKMEVTVQSTIAASCGAKTCVCVCCLGTTQVDAPQRGDAPMMTLVCVCGPPCSQDIAISTPTPAARDTCHRGPGTCTCECCRESPMEKQLRLKGGADSATGVASEASFGSPNKTAQTKAHCTGVADCACGACEALGKDPAPDCAELREWARAQLAATDQLPQRLRELRARALQCDMQCQRILQLEEKTAVRPTESAQMQAQAQMEERGCQCGLGDAPTSPMSPSLRRSKDAVSQCSETNLKTRKKKKGEADGEEESCERCSETSLQLSIESKRASALEQEVATLREQQNKMEDPAEGPEDDSNQPCCACAVIAQLSQETASMQAAALLDTIQRLSVAEEAAAEAQQLRCRMVALDRDLCACACAAEASAEATKERDRLLRIKCELECAIADQEDEIQRLTEALERAAASVEQGVRRGAGDGGGRAKREDEEVAALRAQLASALEEVQALRAQAVDVEELERASQALEQRLDVADARLSLVDAELSQQEQQDAEVEELRQQSLDLQTRLDATDARLALIDEDAASFQAYVSLQHEEELSAALAQVQEQAGEAQQLRAQLEEAQRSLSEVTSEWAAPPEVVEAKAESGECECGAACDLAAEALKDFDVRSVDSKELDASLRTLLFAGACAMERALAAVADEKKDADCRERLLALLAEHETALRALSIRHSPDQEVKETISATTSTIPAADLEESLGDLEDVINQLREDKGRLEANVVGPISKPAPASAIVPADGVDENEKEAARRKEREQISAALQELYKELMQLDQEKIKEEEEIKDLLMANEELWNKIAYLRSRFLQNDD